MPRIQLIRRGHLAIDIVKLVVCAIMLTHGTHRYLYGEIPGLADALQHFGFPAPLVLAHLVNLAETGGVLLIALGLFVRTMCAIMVAIFATGIVLIHWQLGFFIVGPGEGGWEFSALLITCFCAVAMDYGLGAKRPDNPSRPTVTALPS